MKGSLAAFGTLFLVLSTHALKLPFQKRAVRGFLVTSHPLDKNPLGQKEAKPLGNINDFRVSRPLPSLFQAVVLNYN